MTPIIITGGAQRLGLAISKSLQNQGQSVVVTYRTYREGVDELREMGVDVRQVDFADRAATTAFIEQIRTDFPAIRGIIHNASDWGQESQTDAYGDLFDAMMHIHAKVPYQINLALKENLLACEAGADIIHMTDYVQDTGSSKHIAYAASKAALQNLTLSFSQLLAPTVKVNSIAPALLMFNESDDDAYKKKALKKSLLQVCPGAEEACEAVNYLLSSQYVTGRCLHLDGGRHLKR